jgi:hypothetical protein
VASSSAAGGGVKQARGDSSKQAAWATLTTHNIATHACAPEVLGDALAAGRPLAQQRHMLHDESQLVPRERPLPVQQLPHCSGVQGEERQGNASDVTSGFAV